MIKIKDKLILTFMISLFLIPAVSYSKDVCDEARDAWRTKHINDITSRRARVKVRERLLEMIKQSDQLDLKKASIKEKRLDVTSEERVLLNEELEKVSADREKIYNDIKLLQKEYSKISNDQNITKINDLLNEMDLRTKCVLNEPLNEELSSVLKSVNRKRLLSGTELSEFNNLVSERTAQLNKLKDRSKELKGMIDLRLKKYNDLGEDLDDIYVREQEIDNLRDTEYNLINSDVDEWFEILDNQGEQLSRLSEAILKHTQKIE